jgi:hypothetical protein
MTLPLDLPEERSAVVSECGRYRYELIRRWADGPLLEWVMLNPSTADADEDDPTIRRCIGFARDWGHAGIRVTNLFAYRATDPAELLNMRIPPWGRDNPDYLRTEHGPVTVVAWGSHPVVEKRGSEMSWLALWKRSALMCLGVNKDGSPKHPLYVPKNAGLRPWPKPDPKQRWY